MNVTRDRSPRGPTPALGQPRVRNLTPAAVGVMGRYRLFERIRVQELGDTFVAATRGVIPVARSGPFRIRLCADRARRPRAASG